MALFSHKLTLAANAGSPSDYIILDDGSYRIDVDFQTGVTGTITPRQTMDEVVLKPVLDCTETEIALTESKPFGIHGPIKLGFIVASLTGGNAVVYANKIP